MAITSRQDLSDFCLRQLGGGVVDIEVSPEQLADNIELAIEMYHEYHFDGIERDYIKHKVTPTVLTVADGSKFQGGMTIVGVTTLCSATVIKVEGNDLTINKMRGENQFAVENITTTSVSDSIVSIALGTLDKGYITVDETIMGVIKVINLSNVLSSSDYMFNAQYQIMLSEIQNIAHGQTQYLYGVMNYMSHLDNIMRKEKNFRFNRRMNKIFLDINWESDIQPNEYIVIEVYKALDDSVYTEVLNDMWLKKYATALTKRQHGQNLSKYDNMALPGGMTMNGKYILEQAKEEIAALEQALMNEMAPLSFFIG